MFYFFQLSFEVFSAKMGPQGDSGAVFSMASLDWTELVLFEKTVFLAALLNFLHMLAAFLRENGAQRLNGAACDFLHLLLQPFHLVHQVLLTLVDNAQCVVQLLENFRG